LTASKRLGSTKRTKVESAIRRAPHPPGTAHPFPSFRAAPICSHLAGITQPRVMELDVKVKSTDSFAVYNICIYMYT